MDATQKLARAYRAILVLLVLVVALGATSGMLALRRPAGAAADLDAAVYDPEIRRAALQELIERGGGGSFDGFPDPAVARLLQTGLRDRSFYGLPLGSNEIGLRERSIQLPKWSDTIRVVVLGDSFVMGTGVRGEERLGVYLEQLLVDRARGTRRSIEVLHYGIAVWNLLAECAFLRRQLALVRPDLVIHVVIKNDLDDNPAARGMGTVGMWDVRRPERGDTFVRLEVPKYGFGTRRVNWLAHGLDWESRSRFEECGREIARLARAVEAAGGKYFLLDHFTSSLALSRRYFAAELRPEQVAALPATFADERGNLADADGFHWSPAGHQKVAQLLYAIVQSRGLLPSLDLQPDAESARLEAELLPVGESEAQEERSEELLEQREIAPQIDFARIDEHTAAQVNGGVVKGGLVSPYASLLLRSEGRRKLAIAGQGLGRPEIDGVKVAVLVDDVQVGTLEPVGKESFDVTFDVPQEVARQRFVSVRFQADDFCYALPDLRAFQVFKLGRVALTRK